MPADLPTLRGFSADASKTEHDWEAKFRTLPDPAVMRAYMQRLSRAPPSRGLALRQRQCRVDCCRSSRSGAWTQRSNHSTCSSRRRKNARSKWSSRRVSPPKFEEPAVAGDPTSSQASEQLPTYNAYSIDGDVTAPLVYVNYGIPEDYDQLERLGISVKGAIVIARYGEFLARYQAESSGRARRRRLPDLFGPARRRVCGRRRVSRRPDAAH